MKKIVLFSGVLFLALTAAWAETVLYRMDADKNAKKFDGGGTIYTKEAQSGQNCYFVKGRNRLMSMNQIKIQPDKKYRASFYVKAVGESPAQIFAGWICYDKKGKVIPSEAFHSVRNSLTEVVSAAVKGDRIVKIKDGSKWKKGKAFQIAFNAKKDDSDLPNYQVYGFEKLEKKDGVWQITLQKPLAFDVVKGTFVREHIKGGDFLFVSNKVITPGEWQKLESIWYPGKNIRRAFSVRMVLITNLAGKYKNSQILIDDLEMKMQGGNVEF